MVVNEIEKIKKSFSFPNLGYEFPIEYIVFSGVSEKYHAEFKGVNGKKWSFLYASSTMHMGCNHRSLS